MDDWIFCYNIHMFFLQNSLKPITSCGSSHQVHKSSWNNLTNLNLFIRIFAFQSFIISTKWLKMWSTSLDSYLSNEKPLGNGLRKPQLPFQIILFIYGTSSSLKWLVHFYFNLQLYIVEKFTKMLDYFQGSN